MSISEIFDHGAPHPWANLRINNLTVDGSLNIPSETGTLSITFGGAIPSTTFSVAFQKIGTSVSLNFPNILSNGVGGVAGPITAPAGSIPANLIPQFLGAVQYNILVKVENNNVISLNPGVFVIGLLGTINIFLDTTLSSFGVTNTRGSFAFVTSYASAT